MQSSSRRAAYRVAVALVTLDLALIGLHGLLGVSKRMRMIDDIPRWLDIGTDWSVSEFLNNGKWLAITLLLLLLWYRTRMTTAAGYSVVFAVILVNEVLHLHGKGGTAIAAWLSIGGLAGFRGQDLGELIFWAGLGVAIIFAVGLSHWAAGMDGRRIGRVLLLFVGALVTFAVGIDMLHSSLSWRFRAKPIVGLIEDGGEMITGSLCLAWCLGQVLSARYRAMIRPH
jgi:hypothetical protein